MGDNFVFLSTISWADSGGAHRPVQWAKQLLKRGNRVLYVEIESSRVQPIDPNLVIVSVEKLGLSESDTRRAWYGLHPQGLAHAYDQLVKELNTFASKEAERNVVIWFAPYIAFVRFWPEFRSRGFLTVYDCIDDFEGLNELGFFFSNSHAEKFLATHCDLTVTGSPYLERKLRSWAPNAFVHLLRSGVSEELLEAGPLDNKIPTDLVRGDCTLGFWGTIADWTIDVSAIEHISNARPSWTINLIGPVDPDSSFRAIGPRLRKLPNVHLLGPVKHSQLPYYLSAFDVCLIPFARNRFNLAREPIKLYEYLAGFKPVVALNTPYLDPLPFLYVAETNEAFLDEIERARSLPVNKIVMRESLLERTWDLQTSKLCHLISASQSSSTPFSEVLPDFHPEPILPLNWQAYNESLEQLLHERTEYINQMEQNWQETQAYVRRLEQTHPLFWLRGILRKARNRN